MPRKRKIKSREERTAEEYFKVDEDDLKRATEKKVKESVVDVHESVERGEKPVELDVKSSVEKSYSKPDRRGLETVESVGKKVRKKYPLKKTKKNVRKKAKSSMKKYSVPEFKLKKGGYELVITEKPQAALKIASALGDAVQRNDNKIAYYEVDRKGKKIVVACAVGHLFTLKQDAKAGFPVFEISWVPNYLVRKKDFSKKYFDVLAKLAKNAGSLTVATDFDIEGEVIGLNVVRYICGQKDASRMKFSTLTSKELNDSYDDKSKSLEWGQAIAGETRHYLDWFYGINLSRVLMSAIKSVGRFKIMSVGRVQGPALNMIVKKEREIQAFEPKPYWQVFIKVKNSHKVELKYVKDIFGPKGVSDGDKKELNKFNDLVGKEGDASTEKKEQRISPNVPFNLTSLQTEIYKFHGITPSRTLRIAQSLYLAGLISYPRTSSQKLPDSIDYKSIKNKLANEYKVEHLVLKDKPIEGKKVDPAHPSIYPTGDKQILSGEEEKVYNLIVKRFLALFCEDAVIENKRIVVMVDDLKFAKRGVVVKKKAWLEFYPSKIKEDDIPDLNGKVKVVDLRFEEKETQPPKRYSPASIVSELEKRNLGTKATRASILETLYDRGYIKEKSITATPLGISLISTLEKYSPIIIDEELTRDFEKDMESIQNSKKDFEVKEKKIINKAKKTIKKIVGDFDKHEEKVGKELVGAQDELRAQEKIENTLMQCPKCKKGNLAITYSRKTRRHFVACNAYPDCKNTFSLPPNGLIKKTDKICEKCGFPMLMRLMKGKRPWVFCFNPECETNKEWAKKRNV